MRKKCSIDNCKNISVLKQTIDGVRIYRSKCRFHHRNGRKQKRNYPSSNRKTCYREVLVSILGGKCALCNSEKKLQIHHILPVSSGGKNELNNLKLLCYDCHYIVHYNHLFN